jgi:hypothetical protein
MLTDREQSSVPAVLAGMMRTDGWLERDATGVGCCVRKIQES